MSAPSQTPPAHIATRPERRPLSTGPILLVGGAVTVATAVALPDEVWVRWLVALLISVTVLVVALRDVTDGVVAALGYFLVQGFVRRVTSMTLPDPSQDPLLLVGPALASALTAIAIASGALKPRSPLLVLACAWVVLASAAVVNTIDATLRSNIEGLLFWVVPVLWFLVGRALLDEAGMRKVLRFVVLVGTLSCLVGIYQVTVGMPSWDQRWVELRGYAALGVEGFRTLRPFGTLPSHSEFAQVAAIVALISGIELWDAWRDRARPRAALALGCAGISLVALGLSGTRTVQVLFVVAVFVGVIASGVIRPAIAILVVAVSVLLFLGSVQMLDVDGWHDQGLSGLARRSILGIAEPFDPQSSTLRGHLDLTGDALRRLDDRPLGAGPAFGTLAREDSPVAGRFSAENDLGNAALAFGFPGVLAFVALTFLGLQRAWRAARARPTVVTLALLCVLVATLRFWITGAHYGTAMLVWLSLGFLDRPQRA